MSPALSATQPATTLNGLDTQKMVETVELNALKLENLLSRRNAGETSAMDFEKQA